MASREDILVENLKEALSRAHRNIVLGTTAALTFLLLVIPEWKGGPGDPVKIYDLQAPRVFAEVVAAATYCISGFLAYLAVLRAHRIKERLDSVPHIREAALMYPALPAIIDST